ncbi:LysM peptidoglycan-binding domain-containing M23 family metallopeptidase [Corallococcus macrosporus]|uniref:LysM peptidoglycan-binding domain-containing M23 family metallopeptidase n=1 Tax=Corallococcus macrosporus TaxID=35 RepID=UPI000BB2D579|nr:M23 family metallopeptidase [Corallococcus macrosporus]
MAPCVSSRARGALRVFLLAVLLSGCAGTRASSVAGPDLGLDAASPEAEAAGVSDADARTTPLPFNLRGVHAEPELVSVRHRVAPGETMYRISRTYGLTVEELGSANGITAPWTLAVGQELVIPGVERGVPVRALAEADPEPVRTSVSTASRRGAGRREEPPSRSRPRSRPASATGPRRVATQGQLDWPLRGVLYGRFGKKGKEPHDGIDLAAPSGTPVKTAQAGTVLYAGEQRGYGNIVIVEHTNKLITLYAHNRDLRVKTGQKVRRAQVIATVGESGRTSGPHLHFEVRLDGRPVDPLDYLGPMPSS